MRGEGFPLRSTRLISVFAALGLALLAGCAKNEETVSCADPAITSGPRDGSGKVFLPDPGTSSRVAGLLPGAELDAFAVTTPLARLSEKGVLSGDNVDVRSGNCFDGASDGYGASTEDGQFLYLHSDPHFQEVMSYAHGDRYRAALRDAGALVPEQPIEVIAHCEEMDNAYYFRARDAAGGWQQVVCLGDSVSTPGASFADDGMVIVHEIQHAMTVNAYDSQLNLNRFFYDEAGALNEGLSDFLTLLHLRPSIPSGADEKIFSPWALGSFFTGRDLSRTAHRCPAYSADFSGGCGGYSLVEDEPSTGFSARDGRVSFTYPDGLGWPVTARGSLREIHAAYSQREEIHANGVVIAGALWDAYEAVLAERGDHVSVEASFMAVIRSALMALPKPTLARQSPVTFPGFAAKVLERAASVGGFTAGEREAMRHAFALRGLTDFTELAPGWAGFGPGGVRVHDHPLRLRDWLIAIGGNAALVNPLAQIADGKLQAGETAAIWFDVANLAPQSAGGVVLTATSTDAAIRFVDGSANVGPISAQSAQVMLAKINGSRVVDALRDDASAAVATAATSFETNPRFDRSPVTALWIQVDRSATPGQRIVINVEVQPANGAASTLPFEVVIQ